MLVRKSFLDGLLSSLSSSTLPFASLSSLTTNNGLVSSYSLQFQQYRGRKRNLKAGLSKAEKAARRQAKEEKEAERKKYTFMQRAQIRRMKSLLSPSEQFPGRYSSEAEQGLPGRPTTNVFISSTIKTQFFEIAYALELFRKLQSPAIYNNPDASIPLRVELNMTTEKATKMIANSEEIVPIPFPFKHNEKRAILAFVNDEKLQELAVEKGAEIAVGANVVKKIVKGQFRVDDYDFCVAHSDMIGHISPLRGVLKTKCPTRNNGALGDDLGSIIEQFKSGVKLSIQGDPVYPMWGLCNVVVGKLSMTDEQIEANIGAVIAAICRHRNPALGNFVNRAVLMALPSKAYFAIDVQKFVPTPTEEDMQKISKKKRKSKDPKTEPASAADTSATQTVSSAA